MSHKRLDVELSRERGLPELLRTFAGEAVHTAQQWGTTRRPELLDFFTRQVFGRASVGRPASLRFAVDAENPHALEGAAKHRKITIAFDGPHGVGAIHLSLYVPNPRRGPRPTFLLINNRGTAEMDPANGKEDDFWSVRDLIARGYATACFDNTDLDPDFDDKFQNGIHGIFDGPAAARPADAWGAIAAWAWGASRVMDYLATDADINTAKVAAVGHSRGGKTALWAGATDERFALTISNESGCSGAALARGKGGEQIAQIVKKFAFWFAPNYATWVGRENELPTDHHALIALIAPRLAYVSSAAEDAWADPASEFAGAACASPAWELHGLDGLVAATRTPHVGQAFHEGRVGYHVREGVHDLVAQDWSRFIDFADRHWGKPVR